MPTSKSPFAIFFPRLVQKTVHWLVELNPSLLLLLLRTTIATIAVRDSDYSRGVRHRTRGKIDTFCCSYKYGW